MSACRGGRQAFLTLPNSPAVHPQAVHWLCVFAFTAKSSHMTDQAPNVHTVRTRCSRCDVLGPICSVGLPHTEHFFISCRVAMMSPVATFLFGGGAAGYRFNFMSFAPAGFAGQSVFPSFVSLNSSISSISR